LRSRVLHRPARPQAVRPETEQEGSHRGDKTDRRNNRQMPGRVDGDVANQTASRHRQTTAGPCWCIHSARCSRRVRCVVVSTAGARSQLPCRSPAHRLPVQRCTGMGSTDQHRQRPRRLRPDIRVVPVRQLLHGRARIGERCYVRRNRVEPAHPSGFRRRRARFGVMPDCQLLYGRRRSIRISLHVQRQHVELCSYH
jgi:hypothetical protein